MWWYRKIQERVKFGGTRCFHHTLDEPWVWVGSPETCSSVTHGCLSKVGFSDNTGVDSGRLNHFYPKSHRKEGINRSNVDWCFCSDLVACQISHFMRSTQKNTTCDYWCQLPKRNPKWIIHRDQDLPAWDLHCWRVIVPPAAPSLIVMSPSEEMRVSEARTLCRLQLSLARLHCASTTSTTTTAAAARISVPNNKRDWSSDARSIIARQAHVKRFLRVVQLR